MSLIPDHGFHDATVMSLTMTGQELAMLIEDIYVFEEQQDDVVIVFSGVSQIMIDGIPSIGVESKGDFGNLLAIEASDGRAHFLIEWVNIRSNVSIYNSYQITCDRIALMNAKTWAA